MKGKPTIQLRRKTVYMPNSSSVLFYGYNYSEAVPVNVVVGNLL